MFTLKKKKVSFINKEGEQISYYQIYLVDNNGYYIPIKSTLKNANSLLYFLAENVKDLEELKTYGRD